MAFCAGTLCVACPAADMLNTKGEERFSMEKIQRCIAGALAGYAIYLLVAWIYIAVMKIATGGSPDTYMPFMWPFMSPFLIYRYSWQGPPLDENLLSLFGGLLLIGGAIWGYLDLPRGKVRKSSARNADSGDLR